MLFNRKKNPNQPKSLAQKFSRKLNQQEMKAIAGAGPTCCIEENGSKVCFTDEVK